MHVFAYVLHICSCACMRVHACLGMFVCVGECFSFVSKGLSCQCCGLCSGTVASHLEDSTVCLGISTSSTCSHFRMVEDGVGFVATWLELVDYRPGTLSFFIPWTQTRLQNPSTVS